MRSSRTCPFPSRPRNDRPWWFDPRAYSTTARKALRTHPRHGLNPTINACELMRDVGIVRVGDVPVRPGQALQFGGPPQSAGMPAVLLRSELGGMAGVRSSRPRRTGRARAARDRTRRIPARPPVPRPPREPCLPGAMRGSGARTFRVDPSARRIDEQARASAGRPAWSQQRARSLRAAAGSRSASRSCGSRRRASASDRAAPAGSNRSASNRPSRTRPRTSQPGCRMRRSAASTASVIARVSAQWRDKASRVSAWSGSASRAAPSAARAGPVCPRRSSPRPSRK